MRSDRIRPTSLADNVHVGPHEFQPIGRFFHRDKCRVCKAPREIHPMKGYSIARPLGDKS